GTSTDDTRRSKLGNYGADLTVDTRDANWAKQVLKATGGRGVNLVIDQISGETINDAMACTAILGRIINVGRLGRHTAAFDFDLHARRGSAYGGVTHRTRSKAEIRAEYGAMRGDLWPAVEQGELFMPIDKVLPLEAVTEALAYMRANRHFGKIVLTV